MAFLDADALNPILWIQIVFTGFATFSETL